MIDDTTVVAVEYMGITSHTNWFLNACVEPRWLDVDENAKVMSVVQQRSGGFRGKGWQFMFLVRVTSGVAVFFLPSCRKLSPAPANLNEGSPRRTRN